jgi:L-asparaginase
VLTGAMRPMTALSNDAELNVLNCVRVAANPVSADRGVLVVLNNEIQAARDVTKGSTSRVEAFKTNDLGFLGYADSDGEVVFYRRPEKAHTHMTEFDVDEIGELPRVDIALAYSGSDGVAVKAFVQAGCAGLVAAGLGSGAGPRPFLDALTEVVKSGIPVVVASQAGSGRVMARRGMVERGFILADNLLPKKARILLTVALTRTRDPKEIQRMMQTY